MWSHIFLMHLVDAAKELHHVRITNLWTMLIPPIRHGHAMPFLGFPWIPPNFHPVLGKVPLLLSCYILLSYSLTEPGISIWQLYPVISSFIVYPVVKTTARRVTTYQQPLRALQCKLGNSFLRHRQGISHQVLELLPVQGTRPILVAESKEPQIHEKHLKTQDAQQQRPNKTPRNNTKP